MRAAWVLVAVLVAAAVVAASAASSVREAFFPFNVKPDGQRTVVRHELVRQR